MIELYQIDAFASELFSGNPAAVVPLPHWPNDSLLQNIASENNLAETSFLVKAGNDWELRWFTPTAEVALCGHATLAAAHVVYEYLGHSGGSINFITRESGTLVITKAEGGMLSMSFPIIPLVPFTQTEAVTKALGAKPVSVWRGNYSENQYDVMAVFSHESDVATLEPELSLFEAIDSRGIIVTAPGNQSDFVSRYFGPNFGIPEDPVTGSAHCLTAPFWSKELDSNKLTAIQLSQRTGFIECQVKPNTVVLTGRSVEYLKGTLSSAIDLGAPS